MKELHPTTALLERNLEHLQAPLLLINPPEYATVEKVLEKVPKSKLVVLTSDWHMFSQCKDNKVKPIFNTDWQNPGTFKQSLLCLPKSDAEILMTLVFMDSFLKNESSLGLVGQNNAGIKSAKKTLLKLFGDISFQDNARHSAFYLTKASGKEKFNLDLWWESFDLELAAEPSKLKISSLPGTFSHGRLDEGTAILLNSLETKPIKSATRKGDHILDWGCGSGTLGLVLALQFKQAEVLLVDSSAQAITSTQKNIEQNQITNAKVKPSHLFTNIEEKFDAIVANPPFHKGRDTHYADTETMLKEAASHLHPHGTLRIVANNFLRYEQFLKPYFSKVFELDKNKKYKILEASGPKS